MDFHFFLLTNVSQIAQCCTAALLDALMLWVQFHALYNCIKSPFLFDCQSVFICRQQEKNQNQNNMENFVLADQENKDCQVQQCKHPEGQCIEEISALL
jgi:hypothetical protein